MKERRYAWGEGGGVRRRRVFFAVCDCSPLWVPLRRMRPIGFAVNPNIATMAGFICDKDGDRARKKGLDGALFFAYSLVHYFFLSQHTPLPGKTNVDELFEKEKHVMGMAPEAVRQAGFDSSSAIVDPGGIESLAAAIGSPLDLRQKLRAYEEAWVDQVILIAQAGRNRHDDLCASIELFAKEVLPEFKEREVQRQQEKAARLAPIMDRLAPKLEAKLAEAKEHAASVTEAVVAQGSV